MQSNTHHCPSAKVLDRLLKEFFPGTEPGYEHIKARNQQACDRRRMAENTKNIFCGPNYIQWKGRLGIDQGSKMVSTPGSLIEPRVNTLESETDTDTQADPAGKSQPQENKEAPVLAIPDEAPGDKKRDPFVPQTDPQDHTSTSIQSR